MSTSIRERRERSAAALSERTVELRREDEEAPQRLVDMERWRRKGDEPARKHHANGILALRCWTDACGYNVAKSYDVLSVAVAAAAAAGESVCTLLPATPQSSPENEDFRAVGVTDLVTPTASEPIPDETEVREKLAMLVEAGGLDEENAQGFEALAHDPEVRRAFARRYMRHENAG
jgi:hypothetical protein